MSLALAQWGEPPVLVGHSLGGLLAQRLLGRVPLRGLVMMASLPPEGLGMVGPRIAMTDAGFWVEALAGSLLPGREPAVALARHWLFSEGLPLERAQNYAAGCRPRARRRWPRRTGRCCRSRRPSRACRRWSSAAPTTG